MPVGSREHLPVDVLQIVAGTIVTILAELGAVAVEGTAVQTATSPSTTIARDQLEVARSARAARRSTQPITIGHGRRHRLQQPCRRSDPHRCRRPPPGSSRSTRWRSTGSATARMSSSDATLRPSSSARALRAEQQRLSRARTGAPLAPTAGPPVGTRPAVAAGPASRGPAAARSRSRSPPRARRAPAAAVASTARPRRHRRDHRLVVRRRLREDALLLGRASDSR